VVKQFSARGYGNALRGVALKRARGTLGIMGDSETAMYDFSMLRPHLWKSSASFETREWVVRMCLMAAATIMPGADALETSLDWQFRRCHSSARLFFNVPVREIFIADLRGVTARWVLPKCN